MAKAKATAIEKKESKVVTAMDQFRGTVMSLTNEFKAALPPQIPVDRFVRTLITTVQMNPELLACDRKSVLATAMKASQDGLLLDGREAAPVIFKNTCQYIPMVAGILKKMRNSGEIASATAHVVYEKDFFHYELGDDEKITHKPTLADNPGPMVAAYAIVRTKDGGVYREVMSKNQIEKVRAVSKAKDGPWKTWYDEMARKTVLKRVAKRAPSSADLEAIIEHDNAITGFVQTPSELADHDSGRPAYLAEVVAKEEIAVNGSTTPSEESNPKVDPQVKTEGFDAQRAVSALRVATNVNELNAAWDTFVKGKANQEELLNMSDIYNERVVILPG